MQRMLLLGMVLVVLLSGCADYAGAPARWSGYRCPSPSWAAGGVQ